MSRARSPRPIVRDSASFPKCVGGQISYLGSGPAFPCLDHQDHYPRANVRNMVVSPVRGRLLLQASKGQIRSARPSYFIKWFNTWVAWAPVVIRAMDIHTEPSYCRSMDPDEARCHHGLRWKCKPLRSRWNQQQHIPGAPSGGSDPWQLHGSQ